MDPIDQILATAISDAQARGTDAKSAAEEAAEAYKAGLAAYMRTTPQTSADAQTAGQTAS